MLIAKTNISIGDYYFDKGSEVILPKELIGRVRGLCDEVPGKSTEYKEAEEPEVKEKLMKTDILKDKKLKSYKNK